MLRSLKLFAVAAASLALSVGAIVVSPAATASAPASERTAIEQQLIAAINADRAQAGLTALVLDDRLTAIARQRDQYMIDHGFFSHCVGGEPTCAPEQLQFGILLAQAGFPQYAGAENLAANNAPDANATALTNQQWLASPHHREALMDPQYNATGLSVLCCTSMQGAGGVRIVTQIFQNFPASELAHVHDQATAAAPSTPNAGCQFVLGFATLHGLDSSATGDCVDNQSSAANGDAVQHTTKGLMVWRKADNWTAFTNGDQTWIIGPSGLGVRPNGERFSWESNPQSLPIVDSN